MRHCKVDLIRGIWGAFKNESYFSTTPTTAFGTPLNGQLAWEKACWIVKRSQKRMNGRPDYFVANDSCTCT